MRGAEGKVRGKAGQAGLSAERPGPCIMAVQNGSMEVGSGPRGALSFLEPGAPEGSLGPKVGPASLYFQEAASRVLLSLQLTVLTSGAPGSLHSWAPRLSGPLSLGPEEVARVVGVRTSSRAWLGQEQGLWSV